MSIDRGWTLPFAERHSRIARELKRLPREIETAHVVIEQQQKYLAALERALADAQAAWVDLQRNEGDQLRALQEHHRAVAEAIGKGKAR